MTTGQHLLKNSIKLLISILVIFLLGCENIIDKNLSGEKLDKVKDVEFSLKKGTYDFGQKVTLSCGTADADIYYTTDGERPNYSSKLYTNEIVLDKSMTIRAIALKEGMIGSKVTECEYTIIDPTQRKYSISFDSNNADTTPESITDLKNGSVIPFSSLPKVTKTGFIFDGWYLDNSKITKDIVIEKDIILVAHWRTLSQTPNVSFSIISNKVDYLDTLTLTCDSPNAIIYYAIEPDTNFTKYERPIILTKTTKITAYAKLDGYKDSEKLTKTYTMDSISVSFNTNDANETVQNITDVQPGYLLKFDSLPQLTKEGKKFDGWYLNNTKIQKDIMVSENITLNAKWTNFNQVENVSFSIADTNCDYGDLLTLSCNTENATIYYTLDGTSPVTSDTKLVYNNRIIIHKNVTIKAYAVKPGILDSQVASNRYELKTYSVTFDSNGGNETDIQEITGLKKGDPITLKSSTTKYSLPIPTKTNFNFTGWYLNDTLVKPGTPIYSDTKLVAHWTEYEKTSDVEITENQVSQNIINVMLTCPMRNAKIYYTIDNSIPTTSSTEYTNPIFLDKSCTVKAIAVCDNMYPSNVVQKDVFTTKTYNINYYSQIPYNEPTLSTKTKQANSDIIDSDLPLLTNSNYKFLGWYIDETKVEANTTKLTNDITLFARWEKINRTKDVTISPSSTILEQPYTVTLTSEKNAKIFYKIGESDYVEYTNPFKLENGGDIQAYAVLQGKENSNTLKHHYDIKKYSVYYDFEGYNYQTKYYPYGYKLKASDLPTVDKINHKFIGWSLQNKLVKEGYVITSNITLHPLFEKIEKVNDVKFTVKTSDNLLIFPPLVYKKYQIDNSDILTLSCDTPNSKIYYTLDGSTPNSKKTLYEDPIIFSKSEIVKAIAIEKGMKDSNVIEQNYSLKNYNVTYECESPYTKPNDIPGLKKGDKLTEEQLPMTGFDKENYTFLGWFNNGIKITTDTVITSDLHLVAKWHFNGQVEPVRFLLNGKDSDGNVDYNDEIELSCSTVGATIYYTTDGTEPSKNSTLYEQKIKITDTSKPTHIRAIAYNEVDNLQPSNITEQFFDIKTYTVTFDSNGHDTSPTPITGLKKGDTLQSVGKSLKELSEYQYWFLGWYNGDVKFTDSTVITENVNLLANWKEYDTVATVRFSREGTVDCGDEITLTTDTPSAQIYYSINNSEYALYETPIVIDRDCTLKAYATKKDMKNSIENSTRYTLIRYTIKFNNNGYGGPNPADIDYLKKNDELSYRLPKLSHENMRFEGWMQEDNTRFYSDTKITKSQTLTAIWVETIPPDPPRVTSVGSIYEEHGSSKGWRLTINFTGSKADDIDHYYIWWKLGTGGLSASKTVTSSGYHSTNNIVVHDPMTVTGYVYAYDKNGNFSKSNEVSTYLTK